MEKTIKTTTKKNNSKDWWDEISEGERSSINKGLRELKEGKGIPHEEVVRQYATWFANP